MDKYGITRSPVSFVADFPDFDAVQTVHYFFQVIHNPPWPSLKSSRNPESKKDLIFYFFYIKMYM